ncbi:EamA family transporter, partial [Escherichia sp. R-CC3]
QRPGVMAGMIAIFMSFAGQFAFFTYIRPVYMNLAGFGVDGLTLVLLSFGIARQGTNFVVNGSLILAFFYLVVIGTSLTFSLYLKGAQLIGGPKASILSCAEPLSSALLSLLLLGITFTLPDWLGTLLILS